MMWLIDDQKTDGFEPVLAANGQRIDWVGDPRPFREVLADWVLANNGGQKYGARLVAVKTLRIPPATLAKWLAGTRAPSAQYLIRIALDRLLSR